MGLCALKLCSDYVEMYLLYPVLRVKIVPFIRITFSKWRSCKVPGSCWLKWISIFLLLSALEYWLEAKRTDTVLAFRVSRTIFTQKKPFFSGLIVENVDSCPFIALGSIFSYAVMVFFRLSNIIVWGFELRCWIQLVMERIAATSSSIHSKKEAFSMCITLEWWRSIQHFPARRCLWIWRNFIGLPLFFSVTKVNCIYQISLPISQDLHIMFGNCNMLFLLLYTFI